MQRSQTASGYSKGNMNSKCLAVLLLFLAVLLGSTEGRTEKELVSASARVRLRVASHNQAASSAQDESRGGMDQRVNATGPANSLVHILYTVDSANDMDLAVATAVFSGIYNMDDPGRLRYHFMVPEHKDRVAICETLLAFSKHKKVRQGGREVNFMAEWDSVTKFYPEPDAESSASSSDRREWSDCLGPHSRRARSCLCGSPQFHFMALSRHSHIVPKIEKQVDLFSSYEDVEHGDAVRLSSLCNFARNFAPEILADKGQIPKVIYMDADTVVQGNLAELWETTMSCGKYIQMANDAEYGKMTNYFHQSRISSYMFEGHQDLSNLNAGMIVMAVAAMARDGVSLGAKITHLIDYHANTERLWLKGIQQPSFNLAALPFIEVVDGQWNHRLKAFGLCEPSTNVEEAKMLHWTGHFKPWQKDGCFKNLWERYTLDRKHLTRDQ